MRTTIASAFLMSPAAMGKRLVRAKNKIRQAGIPFRIPEREELPGRLDTVLDAIYAAFAEGWTDPGGTDVVRRDLTEEALFLARLVTELLPEEPEALGLLALMLHAEARRRARRNADGEYVPLAEQDPALWDWQMIDEAEALLRRASALGSIGRYQLEAALQSAHVYRRRTGRRQLGGGRAALRCAVGAHRLAGGRDQSRPGHRGDAWRRRRLSRRCQRSPPMRGSPNTSPTGRRARNCWPGRAHTAKPARRTKSRSASSAIPRSAASCSGVSRRCRLEFAAGRH